MSYINLTDNNLESEHICCAIGDPKHATGVEKKKQWLGDRFKEGHVFRKLDARGKVFIEYAPLEQAWVPIDGKDYMYIYCLWVAGSFKGKGYGKDLLEYCIEDAKKRGMAGVCVLSAKKKKPYLSDKKFFQAFGFECVDEVQGGYELLALSFQGTKPMIRENAKMMSISEKELTIYHTQQCPFIWNGITQVKQYCEEHQIPLHIECVDTLEKAKQLPCILNNYAVFYQGHFEGIQLMNAGILQKLLARFRAV